jgi:opacity protein-like surface antigen
MTADRSSTAIRLAIALLTLCGAAHAQLGEDLLGEVSAYTGWTSGAMGVHPVVGGSTAIVSKYAIGMVETSYIPLGSRTFVHYDVPARHSQLFDFNFMVHMQIPVRRRIRVTPYGLFGPTGLYNRYQLLTAQPNGTVAYTGQDDVKFGFEVGGGFRYHVKETWGVRTEYRYTISNQNFGRILAGVFYQFSLP